jgi:uncharacterized Ntn-hydrolase superfamily protein
VTYSLLGRDPGNGDLFLALASRWPGVGGVVPYFRRGVGLVCAQHQAISAIGEAVLDGLAAGLPPDQAIAQGIGPFDPALRQVAALTPDGGYAHWTGDRVDWHTGVAEADHTMAIGNMLANGDVPAAVLDDFLARDDWPLPERLLAALRAGERAGGDKRGRQAAAIRIWPAAYPQVAHLPIDLRADEDPDPIGVLERLWARRREVEGLDRPSG